MGLDSLLWLSTLSVTASSADELYSPFPSASQPSNFPLKKKTNKQQKIQEVIWICVFIVVILQRQPT